MERLERPDLRLSPSASAKCLARGERASTEASASIAPLPFTCHSPATHCLALPTKNNQTNSVTESTPVLRRGESSPPRCGAAAGVEARPHLLLSLHVCLLALCASAAIPMATASLRRLDLWPWPALECSTARTRRNNSSQDQASQPQTVARNSGDRQQRQRQRTLSRRHHCERVGSK